MRDLTHGPTRLLTHQQIPAVLWFLLHLPLLLLAPIGPWGPSL